MTFSAATQTFDGSVPVTNSPEKLADLSAMKLRLVTIRKYATQVESEYGEKYQDLIKKLDAARTEWEMENAELVARHESAKAELETVEKEVRQAVIDYCRDHNTKKFDEHLSMRVAIKLEYDVDAATNWAKTHAPLILVADKKGFESLVGSLVKTAKQKEDETVDDLLAKRAATLKANGIDFVEQTPAYTGVIATVLPDLTSEGQAAE